MQAIVKSFRAIFVEGRIMPILGVICAIGMRYGLFYGSDLPVVDSSNHSHVWGLIAHVFSSPLVSFVASTVSVFLIAWILSFLNSRFNLLRSRSKLPFVVPLFLLSLHPYSLVMTGNYIAIIFVLLAFVPLLESYQQPQAYLSSFRSSILLAVGSLFHIYTLLLFPLWWIGERLLRGTQFRSFLSTCFGIFLVYVSLFSFYWMKDGVVSFLQPFTQFLAISLPDIPSFTILEWSTVLLVLLFFIFIMVFTVKIYNRDKALTLSFMKFVTFLIVMMLIFQVVYWRETLFFLFFSFTLISGLFAYFCSKTTSKSHVFMVYGIWCALTLLYVSHFIPSIALLL